MSYVPQSEQHQLGARVSCILEQVGALSLVVVVQEVEVEVQSKSESPSPCSTLCRACATKSHSKQARNAAQQNATQSQCQRVGVVCNASAREA